MIVGGKKDGTEGYTNDVEIVSPDPNALPVPDCLLSRNPFPFGTIHNGAGAALAPGKGASRYDVRIGGGSWKSGRSKGGCVNLIV